MSLKKTICIYIKLNTVDYQTVWDIQKEFAKRRLQKTIPNILLLLEHPHTITIGKTGKKENLLANPYLLEQKNIELKEVDRGGDITYHGPGQLIGYPILDLSETKPDVIWYLRQLEETIIQTLDDFDIISTRKPKHTGVWIDDEKIAALGVNVSRWITSHGFALNVSTDLNYFDLIIPCGIRNKNVTSMVKLREMDIDLNEVISKIVNHFGHIFNHKMLPYNHTTWSELSEVFGHYIMREKIQV